MIMKKSIVLRFLAVFVGICLLLCLGVYGFIYLIFSQKPSSTMWRETDSSDESKEKGVFVEYYDALPFEYSDSIFHVNLVFKEAYIEWMHEYDISTDSAMENVLFYKNSSTTKSQQLIAVYDTINSDMGYTGVVKNDSAYDGRWRFNKYRKKYWTFDVGHDRWGNYNVTLFNYEYDVKKMKLVTGLFDDTIRIPIRSLSYYDSVCGLDKTVKFGELVFVRRKDSTQQAEPAKVVKKNEPVTKVESAQGTINDYEYVDLGLSVKWAAHNVGADKPEEVGAYYAWGEKKEKKKYSFDNCKTIPQKPKNKWERVRDMDDIGGNEKYDVARAKWGAPWRLPSKEECEELKDKCKWEYTTLDSIEGCKVIGPNGNSIFLPLTDYRINEYMSGCSVNGVYTMSTGVYWTSQPEDNFYAYFLGFSKKCVEVKWTRCYYGVAVRPVFK